MKKQIKKIAKNKLKADFINESLSFGNQARSSNLNTEIATVPEVIGTINVNETNTESSLLYFKKA